jgi:hypothetical protein
LARPTSSLRSALEAHGFFDGHPIQVLRALSFGEALGCRKTQRSMPSNPAGRRAFSGNAKAGAKEFLCASPAGFKTYRPQDGRSDHRLLSLLGLTALGPEATFGALGRPVTGGSGMLCRQCETENPARAKFCLECGTQLVNVCGTCGGKQAASAKFCSECGQPVSLPEPTGGDTCDLREAREAFERGFILRALRAHGWNITRTAEALGIGRVNLWRKLKALGIDPQSERD